MTTLREAAQQALEALLTAWQHNPHWQTNDAITALRDALAQEEQEPVACECHRCIKEKDLRDPSGMLPLSMSKMILCPKCGNKRCPKASDHRLDCTGSNEFGQVGSVYTHPPRREWVSLTEGEIGDVFHAARNAKLGSANDNSRHRLSVVEIARAIEQALKEKNHG